MPRPAQGPFCGGRNVLTLPSAILTLSLSWKKSIYSLVNTQANLHQVQGMDTLLPLQWRHNGRGVVSNHQPHHCLLNRSFRRRWKKTSKLRVTGLCVGNSPDRWIPRRNGQYHGKCFWWRHHDINRKKWDAIIRLSSTAVDLRVRISNYMLHKTFHGIYYQCVNFSQTMLSVKDPNKINQKLDRLKRIVANLNDCYIERDMRGDNHNLMYYNQSQYHHPQNISIYQYIF